MATSSKAPFLIRFGGKCLRKFVDNELSVAKRDVIATSCFADLARISRFHVPEELLEWVVMNIDPKLREYRHKVSKPIVFTRDMMTKVFNVPSGDKPVERLKNTEHTELRNMDRDRSIALLAFATVLFLGTNNMVPLDYLGSLLDMDRVHEYALDEAILAYCMDQVVEFQEKRRLQNEFMKQNPTKRLKQFSISSCLPALVIVYVDHLDFPVEQVHGHVFDYSLPRALHACSADFELAMAIDRNKKTLELSVFGKRPIRDLCNTPYALDQAPPAPYPHRNCLMLLKLRLRRTRLMLLQLSQCYNLLMLLKLRQRLKHLQKLMLVLTERSFCGTVRTEFNALYEKHKTMFKREVDAALSSFGLVVQGTNESNGINFDVPNLDPEAGFRAGVSMGGVGSSPAAAAIIKEASVGTGGGFGAVIGDAVVSTVLVHMVDSTKDSSVPPHPPSPTHIAADAPLMDLSKNGGEGYENFIRELTPSNPVHSLRSHVFQSVASATTPSPTRSAGPTAAEFQQVEKTIDELTSGPSTHEKITRHKRVAVDFDSAPKMKKVKVNADADALYTKYVLHKQKTKKLKDGESQKCKKYAFSCLMSDLLSVNPARFVPSLNNLREFNRACDDFEAHKSDLIANFATLVKQTKIIKLDIASFPRVNLDEYPQQKTNFDCGFFVILYMENYDGKIMKMFGQIVAATLFNKPTNEIDAAVAIAEQAP
ncbi:hypothetical protein ACQ4PT_038517 [Festuca glaucescens]